MIKIISFSILILFFASCLASDHMGPSDLTIERMEECDNPQMYRMKMPITMKKINRTHAGFSGCVDLIDNLDEKVMLNLTAAKWGDGGWKPNAFNFFDPSLCKVLNTFVVKPWTNVAKGAGLVDGTCPIPLGTYCVDKLALELEGIFEKMLYGKFRVDVFFIIAGETVACTRAFINSEISKNG